MSDLAADPASGRRAGAAPAVLLGALGAAALIAVFVIAMLLGGGGDEGSRPAAATPAGLGSDPDTEDHVLLTIAFEGDGRGRIAISPRGDTCDGDCRLRFIAGTRVTVTADAAIGSSFEGWDDSCRGSGTCSFEVDDGRALSVKFAKDEPLPGALSIDDLCDDTLDDCTTEDTDPLATEPTIGSSDCLDGKDNDGDGLTDMAQDPGCDEGNTEADESAADDASAPPPPTTAANECGDGKDNDKDGLTDTAQDPDCLEGRSEGGGSTTTTAPRKKPAKTECRDGKDNDGDGLIDTAQDPGCEADATEAG